MREAEWRAARAELERTLGGLAEQRLQPTASIAEANASYYLAIMPLHEKLRGDDFSALRSQLAAMMTGIEAMLAARADAAALAEALMALALPAAQDTPAEVQ
jgi:hypothetical protein